MDGLTARNIGSGLLLIIFFGLCAYYAAKARPGPWEATAAEFWKEGEWHKLRAMGQNFHAVGKEDVHVFHLALLACRQLKDTEREKTFASLLSHSRVLSLNVEREISRSLKPRGFRGRITLFRTRLILTVTLLLGATLIFSVVKRTPLQFASAILSALGLIVLLL